MEVIQPACPYQMCESVNPLSASSKAVVNLGGIAGSPPGEFQIEGLSPRKMAKVQKEKVVKDFLRSEKPDVVMIQETKKEECDRRFVGSVWSARNKDWAALPTSGALGGILIIWDSKKLRREEVVLGSFSVSIKFAMDRRESLWLSVVYGPNNLALRKDFWVELSNIVGLSHPRWCVGGDFNVIRRNSPLRSASYTWSNMEENPVCKRLDRFLYSNEWEQVFPQSLQEYCKMDFDHWPIVLKTNPFKWDQRHSGLRICGCNILVLRRILEDGERVSRKWVGRAQVHEEITVGIPFTEEEIYKAIFQMDRDKAPGVGWLYHCSVSRLLGSDKGGSSESVCRIP
ncbi:hypothetical protein CK203_100289 [Vitis vinifera]|uniref:Endonuclease/exonuclease/phosphatase domain-containing protein n=1 Tax=Vitis vinifera TaxID=29760 RepID=A0A438D382_VITVI|nr:hypothetical protein CK203_100289 [Vitis vinifera]